MLVQCLRLAHQRLERLSRVAIRAQRQGIGAHARVKIPSRRPLREALLVHKDALELSERQSKLSQGFDALVTSNGLHTALGLLLALGNTLNAGTARANASGIRIDSTLSSNTKVLTFLARHAQRSAPGLMAQVHEGLTKVAPSCRLDAIEMANELSMLIKDVEATRAAVEAHRRAVTMPL